MGLFGNREKAAKEQASREYAEREIAVWEREARYHDGYYQKVVQAINSMPLTADKAESAALLVNERARLLGQLDSLKIQRMADTSAFSSGFAVTQKANGIIHELRNNGEALMRFVMDMGSRPPRPVVTPDNIEL